MARRGLDVFVITEFSFFWLVFPVALHLSVCSGCTCIACFLLLFFFPSRGCFSYCSVHFLSRFVIFAIIFFYYLHLITLYFTVIMNFGGSFVYSSLSALWLFGLVSSVRLQSLQSLHRESLIKYQLQWLHHRIFGYRYLLWNSRKCLHVFKRMLHTSLPTVAKWVVIVEHLIVGVLFQIFQKFLPV